MGLDGFVYDTQSALKDAQECCRAILKSIENKPKSDTLRLKQATEKLCWLVGKKGLMDILRQEMQTEFRADEDPSLEDCLDVITRWEQGVLIKKRIKDRTTV